MSFTTHKALRESLAAIRKDGYTPAHIAILECLAYRINDKTGICFPSVATIAKESYLSERHTRKVLRQLEEDRIIEIRELSRKSNHYKFHLPAKNVSLTLNNSDAENVVSTGFTGEDGAAEGRPIVPESRLTYNPDPSPNLIRESLHHTLRVSPAENLHTEKGSGTGVPVQGSNQKEQPQSELLKIYGFLMKQIKSECTKPSTRDSKELSLAIEKYGSADVLQVLEALFKKKSKFWRLKLKNANFPVSMFCSSLPTIMEQMQGDEDNRRYWHNRSVKDEAEGGDDADGESDE